jgi:PPK2 family polyphosphate:nucleotide phosphotransferase
VGAPDAKRLTRLIEPLRVPPGSKVDLGRDFDPAYTDGMLKKEDGAELLQLGVEQLADYQERLAAQDTWGVLVVIQGIDASGKDSTIRHVMSGVNPQGVAVHSFKVPSVEELDHDFLWRYAKHVPERGQIGIFNRSHYEEVLVVRVHPELLERERLPAHAEGDDLWRHRYRAINEWERYLVENGIRVVKLFLNVSRDEQRRRFLKRIDHPEKRWKFSAADVQERAYWDDYQRAFSDMLTHTSTKHAPWYVLPADHKWFTRIAAAAAIVGTLAEIDPHYPTIDPAELESARAMLEAEAG